MQAQQTPIAPLLAQASFDPEVIEKLAAAYEDAWQKIEQSGSVFASPRYRRVAREIIAKRIIDMAQSMAQNTAQHGKIEPRHLADDAVRYLAQTYT
jgi:hypothetical protein